MVAYHCHNRGLWYLLLVINDGNQGLIRAVKDVWRGVPQQRCVMHRMQNILTRAPRKKQQRIRLGINRFFYTPSLGDTRETARQFANQWGIIYLNAVEILGRELADRLAFFRLFQRDWKRIRTWNSLKRIFKEGRQRTRVIGCFPTEMSAASLIRAVMGENSQRWRGFVIKVGHLSIIEAAIESQPKDPIAIQSLENVLSA